MTDFFGRLFSQDFMPHGHCYRWQPDILWLNVISDSLIALAYYSIPVALVTLVRKRRDIPYQWMFLMFGGFIIACGTTHLMGIWTVWHGTYRLEGTIKALTAIISISTAIALWRLAPHALKLRSPTDLERLNKLLEKEVAERRLAEKKLLLAHTELERRVERRTEALSKANSELQSLIQERSIAEKALRESEKRFRATFEQAAVGIAHVTVEGRWMRVNEKLCSILKYSREELLNRTFQELTHPDDLPSDLALVGQMLTREIDTYSMEKRYIRGDGEPTWIELTVSLVWDDEHPDYFISVVEEIDDRKKNEEMLRHSEERNRLLIEATTSVTWNTDPRGQFIAQQDSWESYTGQKWPDHQGLKWLEMIHPDDRNQLQETWEQALLEGRLYRAEGRIWHAASGYYRHFQTRAVPLKTITGEVREWIGTVVDVDDKVRAEKTIRETQAQMSSIITSAMDAIITTDANQRILLFNAAAEDMFGFNAEEILGQPIDIVIPVRFREAHRHHVEHFGESKTTRRTMGSLGSIFGLRRDGTEFPIEASISQVTLEGNQLFTVILRDITERTRAEERLKESLLEKEVLLKEIHHRVKNNMQIVSSLIQLQSGKSKDPEVQEMFRESQSRIRTMALLHEKLYQSDNLAVVDFPDYVASLVSMLIRTYSSSSQRIQTRIHIEPAGLNLSTAVPLGLIINELVTNSLKHAFSGSTKGEIHVSMNTSDNGGILLKVEDNGIGLPESFDPSSGQSLGLKLVRILADQIHAELKWRRIQGTRFEIRFQPDRQ